MRGLILLGALAAQSAAAPTGELWNTFSSYLRPRAAQPQVKSATYLGNVTDPQFNRDSCGSVRLGNRAFWTCRDTMVYNAATAQSQFPIYVSTAGWTNLSSSGGPAIRASGAPVGAGSSGKGPVLQMYGNSNVNSLKEYYTLTSSECNTNHGFCSDNSRWAIWPNQPPLVTASNSAGSANAYTFIQKGHIQGLTPLYPYEPACSLYKTSYSASSASSSLPSVSLTNEEFWKAGEVCFGFYGGFVRNGYAYLYGRGDASGGTVLAKVPTGSIDNRSQYQYYNYTAGKYTTTLSPTLINDTTVTIPNAGAGGQGTFYYSSYYTQYIWIGQSVFSVVADFYMSTSPAPEGPWSAPVLIFQGTNGDNPIVSSYSLQAHTSLLPSGNTASENGIYVTWTMQMQNGPYVTPLVYLQFQ
ncbi:Hypothetical predicted protein [Lecanosticta acicola]|uniref:DUF4185 domain-containing protein n=1 Tax=Lecanosticta acicola TaxID=111012 RepID=A0AAI8Z691_9PEZI|nr:Hypothetical predicted protein [Lecanosticta acicola]